MIQLESIQASWEMALVGPQPSPSCSGQGCSPVVGNILAHGLQSAQGMARLVVFSRRYIQPVRKLIMISPKIGHSTHLSQAY